MKKICVITTGGTFGSVAHGGVVSLKHDISCEIDRLYHGKNEVEFDVISPMNLHSENMTACDLLSIFNCIKAIDTREYSGVILTHGTDTLAFTACYLSIMLEDFKIPIALVSANYPLQNPLSNGGENFHFAVEFLLLAAENGVFAIYKNPNENCKAHRADLLLQCAGETGFFHSFNGQIVGEFTGEKFVYNDFYKSSSKNIGLFAWKSNVPNYKNIKVQNGKISQNVLPIKAVSFCDFSLFNIENINTVVAETFHSGTIRTSGENSFTNFCKACENQNIKVILAPAKIGDQYEGVASLKNFQNLTFFQGSFEMAYVLSALGAF